MAPKNNNKKKSGSRQNKQAAPPYVEVKGMRETHELVADVGHTVVKPPTRAPLAVATHYRWGFISDEPLKFRPRDGAPWKFINKYQSGWVPAQDWDDILLTNLVNAHVHVEIDQRGFVQF